MRVSVNYWNFISSTLNDNWLYLRPALRQLIKTWKAIHMIESLIILIFNNWFEIIRPHNFSLVVAIICFLTVFPIIGLLSFHIALIKMGLTTNEQVCYLLLSTWHYFTDLLNSTYIPTNTLLAQTCWIDVTSKKPSYVSR